MQPSNPTPTQSFLSWTPARVIQATLIVFSVLFGFFILYRFRLVVFTLFEAIVISTAITPLVTWLEKKKVPKTVGVALVYTLLLGALLGFLFLFLPILSVQGATILQTITNFYQNLRTTLIHSQSALITQLVTALPAGLDLSSGPDQSVSQPGQPGPAARALAIAPEIFGGLFTLIAVLLLTAYWIL
jgi:predicted PurR-regulated permease PerM